MLSNVKAKTTLPLPTVTPDVVDKELETSSENQISVDNDSISLKNIFQGAAFRVCEKCSKTRVLDFRAAEKFPLGSYRYGRKYRSLVLHVIGLQILIAILRTILLMKNSTVKRIYYFCAPKIMIALLQAF